MVHRQQPALTESRIEDNSIKLLRVAIFPDLDVVHLLARVRIYRKFTIRTRLAHSQQRSHVAHEASFAGSASVLLIDGREAEVDEVNDMRSERRLDA